MTLKRNHSDMSQETFNCVQLVKSIITVTVFAALQACGGGSDGNPDNTWSNALNQSPDSASEQCTVNERNKWIYDLMHDTYLWYEQTPDLDYTSYSNPTTLLRDLRYEIYDRFSYIVDEQDYVASQQGLTTAFGFRFGVKDNRYLVHYVEPGSPTDEAGIKRGDEFLEIGGLDITTISNEKFNELLDTSNGPNTQVFKVVERDSQQTKIIEMTSTQFTVQTVFRTESRSIAGIQTGYLGFSRFLRTSSDELNDAFESLKNDNIQELVLDLRYNGGGLIYVASQLASLIGGDNTQGETFATLNFNDRYSDNNLTYDFTNTENSLDLQRVFVITTGNSCSSSEMVINGLKPFVDVVVIGDNSCGKPIGMSPGTNCEKTLFAINFESRNALGEGEFYDGFTPDCAVGDFPVNDMWDESDSLYKAASDYIINGTCSAESTRHKSAKSENLIMPLQPKAPDWAMF